VHCASFLAPLSHGGASTRIVGALERLAKVQVAQGATPRLTRTQPLLPLGMPPTPHSLTHCPMLAPVPIATEIAKAVVGAAAPPQPPAKPAKPAKAGAPHTAKQPAPAPRKAPHAQPKPATTSTTRDGVRTVVNPGEDAGAVNSVAEALAVLAAQRAGGAKPTGNNRAGSSAPRDGGRNDAGAGAGSAPVAAPGGSGNLLTRQQLRDTLVSLLQVRLVVVVVVCVYVCVCARACVRVRSLTVCAACVCGGRRTLRSLPPSTPRTCAVQGVNHLHTRRRVCVYMCACVEQGGGWWLHG